jgi:hypothetical protein
MRVEGRYHRLHMELNLQKLFGLLCTAVLIVLSFPPAFCIIYEGPIGQPR